jgi:hypothetical protein
MYSFYYLKYVDVYCELPGGADTNHYRPNEFSVEG